jgi:hypothetical protein
MMLRKVLTGSVVSICLLGFASQAQAIAFAVGDSYYMGYINDGIPSGDASAAGYLTILGDMAPSTGPTQIPAGTGETYTRSSNSLCYNPTPALGCPDATTTGIVGGNTTSVNLGTGFLYLLAKYDGPNWGTEVWYVGGLTGSGHTIPQFPPGQTRNELSHWSLFNPGGGGGGNEDPIPEPGSLILLGTGLAVAARRMRRARRA